MAKSLKILFVSSEIVPFAKTGGLADVACALPKAIHEAGHDIRLYMPLYKTVLDHRFVLRDVIRLRNLKVELGTTRISVDVKSSFVPNTKVQTYFLDYRPFFDRDGLYVDPVTQIDFPDNAERFMAFSLATFEVLKRLYWQPDIIHCNDWQSALIPVFLRHRFRDDPFFAGIKTLLTVHNIAFQGNFPAEKYDLTNLPGEFIEPGGAFEYYGKFSFLKSGILSADKITTVSPTYAKEIQEDEDLGCGFSGILKDRGEDIVGILNGVDYSEWNPKNDPYLPEKYEYRTFRRKKENQKHLLASFGLPAEPEYPVMANISRLTEQKGFDILLEILNDLLQLPLRLIILGQGDPAIQKKLVDAMKVYPEKLSVRFEFDERLAHLIEGGADMFLMPSRYEPCGLNQLYSLKYGTIPIVRATGGLADTVIDFPSNPEKGTGFVFREYSGRALLNTIKEALAVFQDSEKWRGIVRRAMHQDFSWKKSSQAYIRVYQLLLKGK